MDNKTGLSLVSIKTPDEAEVFIKDYFEKTGRKPLFELSYKMDRLYLKKAEYLKGYVLSAHAPCPGGDLLPNLGSSEPRVVLDSLKILKETASNAAAFGGNVVVLHAGYTLDSPVYTEYGKRKKVVEKYEVNNPYLYFKEGSICSPDYPFSSDYKKHTEITLRNLKEAAEICAEYSVRLAVENLNPRLTYLFQLPDDLLDLVSENRNVDICLDIGHLWISSLVHGFDYFEAVGKLSRTGRIASVHIHDNNSFSGDSGRYNDDHASLGTGTVPVERSIEILKENCNANLIIEAVSDPLENLLKLNSLVLK